MNIEKPLLEQKVYSNKKPKGYHTIKIWHSEKEKDKYSFSITYGLGVISQCNHFENDSAYQFGQFDTLEDALLAGKLVVND